MIVIVGVRAVTASTTALAISGEMVWRKKVDVQTNFLRRIQRATGERVVEGAALTPRIRAIEGLAAGTDCEESAERARRSRPRRRGAFSGEKCS